MTQVLSAARLDELIPDMRDEDFVHMVAEKEDIPHWLPEVAMWLQDQPASWNVFWSLEFILQLVAQGKLIPAFYFKEKKILGMALWELVSYGEPPKTSVRIEFVSCKNFFAMTGIITAIETVGRKLKVDFIEALTHPTIADYGIKKWGYSKNAVHVYKALE